MDLCGCHIAAAAVERHFGHCLLQILHGREELPEDSVVRVHAVTPPVPHAGVTVSILVQLA
jgi:hypothetical protein